MVPLIMNFVTSPEGDDELKESGLQTFEALVVRCFREVTPFIPEVQVGDLTMMSPLIMLKIDFLNDIIVAILDCRHIVEDVVT